MHAAGAVIARRNANEAIRLPLSVMAGLVPAIHAFGVWKENKAWITATSAVMTAVTGESAKKTVIPLPINPCSQAFG